MIKPLTVKDIEYICHSMMGVDWMPTGVVIPKWRLRYRELRDENIENQKKVLQILSLCQSKLEIMYILGIGYYLHENGIRQSTGEDYPDFWADEHEGQPGIHISEPFCGGSCGNGVSSLLVIPQFRSPEKPIHHDLGLFTGESNGGGPWELWRVVEIEGYGVHKQRREADKKRYSGLSYTVVSLYEETTNPQDWFKVFDPDVETGIPGEWLPYAEYWNEA